MNAIKNWKSKLSRNKPDGIGDVVENLEDFDILLGRGKTSFNHVGNRRFRVFIDIHLQRYIDAQSRMEKTLVVNSVVEAIQDGGGRFLKQDTKTKKWHKVSAKMAREKVGHALRDGVGMQVKAARNAGQQQGNGVGKEQIVCNGRAPAQRRHSGVAASTYKAKRASASGNAGPSIFHEVGKTNSCGTVGDSSYPQNSMIQSAQKVVDEIRNGTFDDEAEEEKPVKKGGSSELHFNNFLARKNNTIVNSRPSKEKNRTVREHSKITIGQSSKKNSLSTPMKRLDSRYGETLKIFDGGSSEFSVGSEATIDKWFDLNSGIMSVNTVDSTVFEEGDDTTASDTKTDDTKHQKLMGQVKKALSDMEMGMRKGGKIWKGKNKLKSSLKSLTDLELSEELSTMSLDTRLSEEFGLRSEELARIGVGMLRSDEFFKSDEFSLDSSIRNANSSEFLLKEMRSSKTKMIQSKAQMHTVDEGTVLDDYKINPLKNSNIKRKLTAKEIEEEKINML